MWPLKKKDRVTPMPIVNTKLGPLLLTKPIVQILLLYLESPGNEYPHENIEKIIGFKTDSSNLLNQMCDLGWLHKTTHPLHSNPDYAPRVFYMLKERGRHAANAIRSDLADALRRHEKAEKNA